MAPIFTEKEERVADAAFRARIDSMMTEMEGMKRQLQVFRERAEKAEAERDADRETLAEMIQRIRQRDEEDARKAAATAALQATAAALEAKLAALDPSAAASATSSAKPAAQTGAAAAALARSPSRGRGRKGAAAATESDVAALVRAARNGTAAATKDGKDGFVAGRSSAASQAEPASPASHHDDDDDDDALHGTSLSRSDTITPASLTAGAGAGKVARKVAHDPTVLQGIPYASMVGVVLIGMGLMAYLNGWQPAPRLER